MSKSPVDGRKPADDASMSISADAVLWLNDLPENVRPLKTCSRFPRVLNEIVAAWNRPAECVRLFEELLLDRRGNRQGFPMDVAFELAALKNFYETAVHPSHQTIWDDIIQRARPR